MNNSGTNIESLGGFTPMDESCTVRLVNEFGQVVNRDGSLYRNDSGQPYFQQTFPDLETAKQFCRAIVGEMPHVGCDVVRGAEVLFRHFDAAWYQRVTAQRHRDYAKMKRRDRLILSGIIGVVLLVVIGCLLLWFR